MPIVFESDGTAPDLVVPPSVEIDASVIDCIAISVNAEPITLVYDYSWCYLFLSSAYLLSTSLSNSSSF